MSSLAASIRYQKRYPERAKASRQASYRRRKEFINWLKDQPCSDCGGKFPPECMDFDHVRGTKLKPVSNIGLVRLDIQAEVMKCDLVCSNCHRIRTRRRIPRA